MPGVKGFSNNGKSSPTENKACWLHTAFFPPPCEKVGIRSPCSKESESPWRLWKGQATFSVVLCSIKSAVFRHMIESSHCIVATRTWCIIDRNIILIHRGEGVLVCFIVLQGPWAPYEIFCICLMWGLIMLAVSLKTCAPNHSSCFEALQFPISFWVWGWKGEHEKLNLKNVIKWERKCSTPPLTNFSLTCFPIQYYYSRQNKIKMQEISVQDLSFFFGFINPIKLGVGNLRPVAWLWPSRSLCLALGTPPRPPFLTTPLISPPGLLLFAWNVSLNSENVSCLSGSRI